MGLYNSESAKRQIDQHKFAAGRKSLFSFSVEEILKQLIIRSRVRSIFSATEKAFASRNRRYSGPHVARGPYAYAVRDETFRRLEAQVFEGPIISKKSNVAWCPHNQWWV